MGDLIAFAVFFAAVLIAFLAVMVFFNGLLNASREMKRRRELADKIIALAEEAREEARKFRELRIQVQAQAEELRDYCRRNGIPEAAPSTAYPRLVANNAARPDPDKAG